MTARAASDPAVVEVLHRGFTFAELRPSPREVGLVLGYPGGELPEVVQAAIDEVAARGEGLWSIEGGCVLVPDVTFDRPAHRLRAGGQEFDVGKIVGGQLGRSSALVVFLCTAGKGIEELSRGLMAGGDPFTGFVADTLGSLIVEAAMDRLQGALVEELAGRGLRITNRYSPGYCEWHVSEQQKLFRLFPAGYCGVSLTDTSLMRPTKTVSGFIGVGPDVRKVPYTCKLCQLQDCLYRRLGDEREGTDG
jgi:hypothetical protein